MNTFRVRIVTPDGEFYSVEAEYMSFRTVDGETGLLAGALPRIVALEPCDIVIKTSVIEVTVQCSGGFVRVGDGVTVITDCCSFENERKSADAFSAGEESAMYDMAKVGIASALKKSKKRTAGDR